MTGGIQRLQIEIEIEENLADTQITIKCREKNAFIDKLVAALKIIDRKIMVFNGGDITPLDLEEILYAESVDGKCFIYTAKQVYESYHKLYELEEQLAEYMFVRISKSGIVNLKNILSIKAYINRRLLITMSNKEQLIVSRQYAGGIKTLLGVK